jgi:hypothetical protein
MYIKRVLTQTNIYHLAPTTLTRVNELLLKAYLIVLKTFPQQFQTRGMNKERGVMKDLALNGHSSKFIQQTSQPTETPNRLNNNSLGFTCIPYIKPVFHLRIFSREANKQKEYYVAPCTNSIQAYAKSG